MHNLQFLNHIIYPVLRFMGRDGIMSAPALLLGTALTESNLFYIKQINGSALGVYQIEPTTHDDMWDNYIIYRPDLRALLSRLVTSWPDKKLQLISNLYYATAMAMIYYERRRVNFNVLTSAELMAVTWKREYNTHLGKGTVLGATPHFARAINVVKGE